MWLQQIKNTNKITGKAFNLAKPKFSYVKTTWSLFVWLSLHELETQNTKIKNFILEPRINVSENIQKLYNY